MLEDLGRREVPVLLAAALHLLILLDPVEDLPQVAWVVPQWRQGTDRSSMECEFFEATGGAAAR